MKRFCLSFISFFLIVSGVYAQEHCPTQPVMYDADGNTYATVQIGTQCWMESNIHSKKGKDGEVISWGKKDLNYVTPYFYYPNNDESNVPMHGYLYNWAAAKKVCPAGWHLPTKDEFNTLVEYCKKHFDVSKDSLGWIAKSLVASCSWPEAAAEGCPGDTIHDCNAAQFSVRPSGMFNKMYSFGNAAFFWTATQFGRSYAYTMMIYYAVPFVDIYDDIQTSARSVRCVKDEK